VPLAAAGIALLLDDEVRDAFADDNLGPAGLGVEVGMKF
jgi:hypothetical protein